MSDPSRPSTAFLLAGYPTVCFDQHVMWLPCSPSHTTTLFNPGLPVCHRSMQLTRMEGFIFKSM
ncbi:hypothetical protein A2U01_0013005, partial [Trifolium medium]|nr:hypothetical protein [Trifolium medium]